MSKYLDKVNLTLDEDTFEELESEAERESNSTDSIETIIETTEVNNNIAEESTVIQKELDAMQDANTAASELAEQVATEEDLLENPEDITDTAAEITQDSFKYTLTSLGYPLAEANRFITIDSEMSPAEKVAVTMDGVKDFLLKIKEHIIAFFRSIKEKIKRLYSKIIVYFSNYAKKAKKLQDHILNTESIKNSKLVDSAEVLDKISRYFPMATLQGKSLDDTVKDLHNGSPAIGMDTIKEIVTVIKNAAYAKSTVSAISGIDKIINDVSHPWLKWFTNSSYLKKVEKEKGKDTNTTHSLVLSSGCNGGSIKAIRWYIKVGNESLVPSVEIYKISTNAVKQAYGKSNIKGVNGQKVVDYLHTVIKLSNNIKNLTDQTYSAMDTINKQLVDELDKYVKDANSTLKQHEIIKVSSVCRTMVSNVAFNRVMDQARTVKALMALCSYIVKNLK